MIALVSIIVATFSIASHISKKEHRELFFKSRLVMKEIRMSKEIPYGLLEEFSLTILKGEERKEVLSYGIKRDLGGKFQANKLRQYRKLLTYKGQRYLHLKVRKVNLLLKDEETFVAKFFTLILVFVGLLSLLVLMYVLLRRSLVPLRQLEKDIKDYGEEKLIDYEYLLKKDEVSLATNAFYHTIEKVERLKSSRELFVRNIFHELNTPVTKGKILAELVEEPQTKVMLDSIFTRLSLLLKELAQMEQLTSGNYSIIKKPIRIQELIDEACDLLYLDTPIVSNVRGEMIEVDFSLMRMVFKNLIENAYKYGEGVEIKVSKEQICFMSKGKALEKSFSYYTEAFTKENETQGFGLGLYIVNEIVSQHDMELLYRYEFGNNIFIIRL
jgi:two-component system OmpR family sensor kinase